MSTPVNKQLKTYYGFYSPPPLISSDSRKLKKCRKYLCMAAGGMFFTTFGVCLSMMISKDELKHQNFEKLLWLSLSLSVLVVLLLFGVLVTSYKIFANEKESYEKEKNDMKGLCHRKLRDPRSLGSMLENLNLVRSLEETNV